MLVVPTVVQMSSLMLDDDACTGRDNLASFLDEGLGTSLDGADSPTFSPFPRNDSGTVSSDEGQGAGGGAVGKTKKPGSFDGSGRCNISVSSQISEESSIEVEVPNWITSTSPLINSTIIKFGTNGNIIASVGTHVETETVPSVSSSPSTNKYVEPITTKFVSESGQIVDLNFAQTPISESIQCPLEGSNRKTGTLQHKRSKDMPLSRQGPQKCTICEKAFSNASALTKHKLTHSDERRHACTTCGKAFKRQDHLNGHMLTHRNKKPFDCKSKGCGKSYCDARSLRRHVENRHGHEILESISLTNNFAIKNTNSMSNRTNKNEQEPEQKSVPALPIKTEHLEGGECFKGENGSILAGEEEPVEAKPKQVVQPLTKLEFPILAKKDHKVNSARSHPTLLSLYDGNSSVEKVEDTHVPHSPCFSLPREGVPIVVKRDNISVFDFDETLEDAVAALPYNAPGTGTLQTPSSIFGVPSNGVPQPTPEKSFLPQPIAKVNGSVPCSKVDSIPDIRLIQEWARKLGDSKVAFFLSSSPSGPSSTDQFSGPLQLSGRTVTTSQAIFPVGENGIYSVTPITIVPKSSHEFGVKRVEVSVTNGSKTSMEAPKPFYILPTQHTLSTTSATPCTIRHPNKDSHKLEQSTNHVHTPELENKKQSTASPNGKEKPKGIGSALANKIKNKLKAENFKKLGRGSEENLDKSEQIMTKRNPSPTQNSNVSRLASIVTVGSPVSPGRERSGVRACKAYEGLSDSRNGTGSRLPPFPVNGAMSNVSPQPHYKHIAECNHGWCESPKDCMLHAMEEDNLSDGGDGDDKPVECAICCRKFKNTPALNGHMRLHGGYFKKVQRKFYTCSLCERGHSLSS